MELDIVTRILQFFHRIRMKLVLWSLVVGLLVFYFSMFIPRKYTVSTSIFTGIASTSGLEETQNFQDSRLKNAFENIINLTKSKAVLERVAIKLLAINLTNGDVDRDNKDITAKAYQDLLRKTPKNVLALVDKTSVEKTEENLMKYYEEDKANYLFQLLGSLNPYYSLNALSEIIVKRIGVSDVLEIVYTSNDPGITLNTVKLVSKELASTYEFMRYNDVNQVVSYFEQQLKTKKSSLDSLEQDLMVYNQLHKVINYEEQTKAIAISFTSYEDRIEQVQRDYQSSLKMMNDLEGQMQIRAQLVRSNSDFVGLLDSLSIINGKITEMEIFDINKTDQSSSKELNKYRQKLKSLDQKISSVSDDIIVTKYSKEGIAIESMVEHWLQEVIRNAKAKKELEVLLNRRTDFEDMYMNYSPVGAQLNSKEREIRVTEQSYLEILHALNLARLKQKNIQLTSTSLNTISEPTFPLRDNGRGRILLALVSMIVTSIFLIGFYWLKDILSSSLQDEYKAKRMTGVEVLGAFPNNNQLLYRGYIKSCLRKSASYLCNKINQFAKNDAPIFVNLISINPHEGKSFIAKSMVEHWELNGFEVNYIRAKDDFLTNNPEFYSASNYETLMQKEMLSKDCHVVIVEYQNLQTSNIPSQLLSSADINIVIVDAQRRWRKSDQTLLVDLEKQSADTKLVLCLNWASRTAVEDFTGALPPKDIS